MEPQPVILPAAPTPTKTPRRVYFFRWASPKFRRYVRKTTARETKSARILARQIARSEHHIRARPLLNNGKAWR